MSRVKKISSFLIAAPKSNSGKTIITLGLLKALKMRGLNVQPFKCGPDYIDPMHHTAISGNSSYNLDTWMADDEHVKSVYTAQAAKSDVAIAEGVMGLFDGAKKDKGSSAEVAKLLDLPVILVVDASSVAYSVAPLLYGYKHFDKELNLAGVIFNKVAGEGHYQFLKDAALDVGVEPLGYMPRNAELAFESRHLGLFMPQDGEFHKPIQLAAELIEEHINLDKILEVTHKNISVAQFSVGEEDGNKKVVAIANDDAFNFMYPANIDALKTFSKVLYFSPLNDKTLPKADVIWLPGGYPELFARELSENLDMIEAIKAFWQNGGSIVAECGGMMYLGRYLKDQEDNIYNMCGLFNYETTIDKMKLTLGYRKLIVNNKEFFGHEFHYSVLNADNEHNKIGQSYSARETEVNMPVFKKERLWASYLHMYLGEEAKMKEFLELITK